MKRVVSTELTDSYQITSIVIRPTFRKQSTEKGMKIHKEGKSWTR